jgi:hypothetical protein
MVQGKEIPLNSFQFEADKEGLAGCMGGDRENGQRVVIKYRTKQNEMATNYYPAFRKNAKRQSEAEANTYT